jgi:hypothetical protein
MSWTQKRRVAKRRSRGQNANHFMTLEFSFVVHFNPISNTCLHNTSTHVEDLGQRHECMRTCYELSMNEPSNVTYVTLLGTYDT